MKIGGPDKKSYLRHCSLLEWVEQIDLIKQKPFGSLDCDKACLVAIRNLQEYEINYFKTFAPMAKMTTIQTLLIITRSQGCMAPFSNGCKNTFLHEILQENVYMSLSLRVRFDSQIHVCCL